MQTSKLDERIFKTVADNGVTVLSEYIPGVRSVAAGIWVKAASANERRDKMGVSHLLEHMVFKGTEKRTARDIALELEVRGGSLDAYTSRDHTSFQARVLDEDLARALDVLTDIVRSPALRESDLNLERNVVLEEISTVEDTPDDLVFDLHASTLWPDHGYGFPILGTRDTVTALGSGDLKDLHSKAYHPGQMVISAAGGLNHDVLLKLLGKYGWFSFDKGPEPVGVPTVPETRPGLTRVSRDSAQAHMVIGSPTFQYGDRRRYALMLLNTVLGGGMSSRLFQRIREELGLAYSVFSFHSFYKRSGVSGVYVGTHPSTADGALEAISSEMNRIAAEGLVGKDLDEAKQQVKGQITLGLESPSSRMYRLAGLSLYDEEYKTLDQILACIDAIQEEEVKAVAAEFFPYDRQTVVWLGPN